MNRSNYYISLDIRDSYGACLLDMKQADTHRRLHITLTDGGLPYLLTPGCYPVFTAKRPDGSGIFNACTVEDNTVIYDITLQDTAVVGLLRCELRLYDGTLDLDQNGIPEIRDENIQLLTCAAFGIRVHPTVYDDSDTPASGDELSALTKTLVDARSTVQAILDAKDRGLFNGSQGEQGPQGEPGVKGEKGDTGAPGADGYTPVRGIDYWTEEDQKQFDAALAAKAEIHNNAVGPDAWSSKTIIDRLCPGFTASGNVAQCQPVEGYPLEVISQIPPSLEGITQLTLTQLGKNLLTNDENVVAKVKYRNLYIHVGKGGAYYWTDNPSTDPLQCHATDFIPCSHLQGLTLTWNALPAKVLKRNTSAGMAFYTEPKDASFISGNSTLATFAVPENANYMRLTLLVVEAPDQQLELGSAETPFEAYTEKKYTAVFGGAICGGSFDWHTGKLTATHKRVELASLEWYYNDIDCTWCADLTDCAYLDSYLGMEVIAASVLCNAYSLGEYPGSADKTYSFYKSRIEVSEWEIKEVSDFVAHLEDIGALLVYPLATPVTVQLDPQTITANACTNTLYSSAGSTRISGKSDPVTIIEKLSTRLAALEDAAI